MGHYKSNVRDLEFNLFEVLGVQDRLGTGVFHEADEDTARGVLSELSNLATGPFAESFADGDRNPPVFDPKTNSVTIPDSFKKAYKLLLDGEWWRLGLTNEFGGFGLPPSVQWAAAELLLGSNPALYMYLAGPNFAMILHKNGTEEQRHWAKLMIDRGWGATMVLTETGELGERNGVYATNVEHKMGLKVSTTCELTFGQHGTPAKGWLLGEVHDGIAQMFQVIEYARMMVGTKAIATLSTGYLNALEYAKERVQGADLTQMLDKSAPRVTIMHHPDVRRSLMLQKSYAEGLRAVYLYTATFQDQIFAGGDKESIALAERVNDLLLPIVKGVGSERVYEQLAQSLQTLGGSGFLQDYPIEQYIRDSKIDSLYEGTTAIQSLDFFFRKIVRDKGKALTYQVHRRRAWQRAVEGGARAAQAGDRGRPGHAGRDDRIPDLLAGGAAQHLPRRTAQRAPADGRW